MSQPSGKRNVCLGLSTGAKSVTIAAENEITEPDSILSRALSAEVAALYERCVHYAGSGLVSFSLKPVRP